jgi:hypothetical protein
MELGVAEHLSAKGGEARIVVEELAPQMWSWSLTRLLSNQHCTPSAKYSWWFTEAYFPFQSPSRIAAS